jgi:hypothetical protein
VKHTPGPWAVLQENAILNIEDTDGVTVLADCDLCDYTPEEAAQLQADYRLMAAAPELLAALELYFANDSRFHKAASDAIAKAKGAA